MLTLTMKYIFRSFIYSFFLLTLLLSGCSGKPVRHLSSEACLIAQGTTEQDVLTYMGAPKFRNKTTDGEVWIFVEEHKSLFKKTPVINWFAGSISYDLVYITFTGDTVTNCQYRSLSEEEYKKTSLGKEQISK